MIAALAAGCDTDFGAYRGRTRQAHDMFRLWQGSVWAGLAVAALVVSLILWSVFRYRRRRHDSEVPGQRQTIVWLELLYTSIPVLIVAVLFVLAYRTEDRVDALARHPGLVVDVTGFRWNWEFHYPASRITVTGVPGHPARLVVPTGTTVRLVLRSPDVIHSFYVPEFLYKRDVIPGITNRVDVNVVDPGVYDGHCAEFCGLNHAKMDFTVEAMRPPAFSEWVSAHRGARIGG